MFEFSQTQTALVIAHPGHELRLFHWLEIARPVVFVLTDGSGRSGKLRIKSTSRILSRAGATAGSIYGRYSDSKIYQATLDSAFDLFHELIDELADALVYHEVEIVLGDAAEGEFMSHDLWRGARLAAVDLAEQRTGKRILHFEFPVDTHPHRCPEMLRTEAVRLQLDDAALQRKLAEAHGYPEIAEFGDLALHQYGAEAFRTESMFPVTPQSLFDANECGVPAYERHGERQVAQGVYAEVVRYHQHVVPLLESFASRTVTVVS